MIRRARRDRTGCEADRRSLALVTDGQDWVARIRAGDAAAFEAMYVAYYRPLCAFVNGCIGSREHSEELVQDLFCRLWQLRRTWQPPESKVRAYLFCAARNRAVNHLKHRRIEMRFAEYPPELPPAPVPDRNAETAEFAASLARAMAALPPRCREACALRWQFGLTYPEIATTMGITLKAVEALITRGLKSTRSALAGFA